MRVDIWPTEWSGLPAIIKSCPYKSAHPIFIFRSQLPPGFSSARPPWKCNVLVGHITLDTIFFICTACGHGAAHFCSNYRLSRMLTMIIRNTKLSIVKSSDGDHFIYTVENIGYIGCISTHPIRIQFFLFARSVWAILFPKLLVWIPPSLLPIDQMKTRVIAIAQNQSFKSFMYQDCYSAGDFHHLIPRLSHASRNSGVGGLWLVLHAFTPMSFSNRTR